MNTFISLTLISSILILSGTSAQAETKSLQGEFKTLGDNQEVIERVKKLDSRQKVRVVQNRLMDRNNRLEAALNFGLLSGADSYVQTKDLGIMLHYHLSPRWSFGIGYEKNYNTLSSEGSRQYDTAYTCQINDASCAQRFPAIDFPLETKMISVSFYPIYGKLNLFDSGIAQFDLFTSIGYGQKTLNSGLSNVMTASLGAGVWLNSFLTARLEARYENYKDLLLTEKRVQNAVSALASIGIMLW